MRRIGLGLLILFMIPLLLDAADGNVWNKWTKELRRQQQPALKTVGKRAVTRLNWSAMRKF